MDGLLQYDDSPTRPQTLACSVPNSPPVSDVWKGAKKLGVRLGNWLTAEEARRFWQSPAQTHSKESGTVRFSPCCWAADFAAVNWLIWTSRIL